MRLKMSGSKNPITANMGKILYSRVVLYIVLIICLFQLFMLTSVGDYYSCAVFVLVGFLTSFFSKNMLVILVIALVVTNILKYGANVRREGFEDAEIDDTSEAEIPEIPIAPVTAPVAPAKTPTKATTPAATESQIKRLEEMFTEYKELLTTQKGITENMKSINEGLSKAEGMVERMKVKP